MTAPPVVSPSMLAFVLPAALVFPGMAVMTAPPVVSLTMLALVISATVAFPTMAVGRVVLCLVLGVMGSMAQPAGFASGRRNQAAVAIPLQQLAQIVRGGVQDLDARFRQALRRPPSYVSRDQYAGFDSLHPGGGSAGAGLILARPRVGLEFKLVRRRVPEGEERRLTIGKIETRLLARGVGTRKTNFQVISSSCNGIRS